MPKRTVDPYEIFKLAEAMHSAGSSLRENTPEDPVKSAPSVVLVAFSLELYLKCLLVLDGKTSDEILGHDFDALFLKLTETKQRSTTDRFNQICQHDYLFVKDRLRQIGKESLFPMDLQTALAESSGAFVNVRYRYENPSKGLWNADPALKAVREIILEEHPEWNQK